MLKQNAVYYHCFSANFDALIYQRGDCEIQILSKAYKIRKPGGLFEYFLRLFGKKQISKSFSGMFLLKKVSSTSKMLLKTLQIFVVKLLEI